MEEVRLPIDFFTNQSFLSLASASGIVFVVSNAIQGAFNFNPRWLALVLAEAVAIYGAHLSQNVRVPSDYFLAALNGCLIYCTAVGGTQIVSKAAVAGKPKGQLGDDGRARRRMFTNWF